MDTYYRTCRAWDSRLSRNYWFDAQGVGPLPRENVAYRLGAIPDLSVVNVTAQRAHKENVFPAPPSGPRAGSDYQTKLGVSAWARNLAYEKHLWVDLHVFDASDLAIQRQTLPLQWQMPGCGDGDSFGLDVTVYHGSTATPGSVSPRPESASDIVAFGSSALAGNNFLEFLGEVFPRGRGSDRSIALPQCLVEPVDR
jgi:hypothetical protein